MKKFSPAIVLVLAAVFGILAVVLANKWLSGQVSAQKTGRDDSLPVTRIVIAAQDIWVGTPLTAKNLAVAEWPKASVPTGAFTEIKEVEGRVAVTQISAGTPLLDAELAAPGSGAGLVAVIPKGQRAMSIRVDEVIGVSGFVLPNTFVDVIGVETSKEIKSAKTILRRIKVLAIAQETHDEKGQAKVVRTVTLQVTPQESEKLALQTHMGAVHLVLRNPLENEPEPEVKVAARPKPVIRKTVSSPKAVPFEVEVIRGSDREKVSFTSINSEDRL